jgi:hypothetical protein
MEQYSTATKNLMTRHYPPELLSMMENCLKMVESKMTLSPLLTWTKEGDVMKMKVSYSPFFIPYEPFVFTPTFSDLRTLIQSVESMRRAGGRWGGELFLVKRFHLAPEPKSLYKMRDGQVRLFQDSE